MFVLYIDGSGTVGNPDDKHFVLAGLAVYERQMFHLMQHLDKVVGSFGIGPSDDVELHGSPMYSGRGRWRGVPRARRYEMILEALDVLTTASGTVRAFGVAVDKLARSPDDPVEYAFEEICNRFNAYLNRNFRKRGGRDIDKQKGLVVMDKSRYEGTLQALATAFRFDGTRWGQLRNLAEVPLFLDSAASRLVQLADLIAFAVWRKYERDDSSFFDRIVSRFDREGGVIHGLVHYGPEFATCPCPACASGHRLTEVPTLREPPTTDRS